jgi:acylphosphatase
MVLVSYVVMALRITLSGRIALLPDERVTVMVSESKGDGVTVVLQWCCSGVTVVC